MIKDDIYTIYEHAPGKPERILGQFAIKEGQLTWISATRMAKNLIDEGPVTANVEHRIYRLMYDASYMSVLPASEILERLEQKSPQHVFEYHREGLSEPHLIHFKDGVCHLDGNPLDHEETQHILDNVRSNLASLRYHRG